MYFYTHAPVQLPVHNVLLPAATANAASAVQTMTVIQTTVSYNLCGAALRSRQDAEVNREIVDILHNIEKDDLLPPLVVGSKLSHLWASL